MGSFSSSFFISRAGGGLLAVHAGSSVCVCVFVCWEVRQVLREKDALTQPGWGCGWMGESQSGRKGCGGEKLGETEGGEILCLHGSRGCTEQLWSGFGEFRGECSRFQESGRKGQAKLGKSVGVGMNPVGLRLEIRGGTGQV